MARTEVVETLTSALLDTLASNTAAADSAESAPTNSEMFSALLTLTSRFIESAIAMGADPDEMKVALNMVAAKIPSVSRTIH